MNGDVGIWRLCGQTDRRKLSQDKTGCDRRRIGEQRRGNRVGTTA